VKDKTLLLAQNKLASPVTENVTLMFYIHVAIEVDH